MMISSIKPKYIFFNRYFSKKHPNGAYQFYLENIGHPIYPDKNLKLPDVQTCVVRTDKWIDNQQYGFITEGEVVQTEPVTLKEIMGYINDLNNAFYDDRVIYTTIDIYTYHASKIYFAVISKRDNSTNILTNDFICKVNGEIERMFTVKILRDIFILGDFIKFNYSFYSATFDYSDIVDMTKMPLTNDDIRSIMVLAGRKDNKRFTILGNGNKNYAVMNVSIYGPVVYYKGLDDDGIVIKKHFYITSSFWDSISELFDTSEECVSNFSINDTYDYMMENMIYNGNNNYENNRATTIVNVSAYDKAYSFDVYCRDSFIDSTINDQHTKSIIDKSCDKLAELRKYFAKYVNTKDKNSMNEWRKLAAKEVLNLY